MSRVKRKPRSKAELRRLALKRTRTYEAYGMIELGLQGIGPRRLAKMTVVPRQSC